MDHLVCEAAHSAGLDFPGDLCAICGADLGLDDCRSGSPQEEGYCSEACRATGEAQSILIPPDMTRIISFTVS